MSGRTSKTLGRGSWYPAEGLSLDLKISLHFLGRGFWVQSDIRPKILSNLVLKLMSLQWSHLLNYINEIPQLISLCINFEGRLHYSVKYILQLLRIYWKTCILDLCNFLLIQRQRIKQKTITTTKKILEENRKLHWFTHVVRGGGDLHWGNSALNLAQENTEY